MYNVGKDKIKKYKTAVLIRRHKAAETLIDTEYLLRSLVGDLDWFGSVIPILGDGTGEQGDEVVIKNKVYELSGASASCEIDIAENQIPTTPNPPAGGDVLIFKCVDKTNTVSVEDEDGFKHTFVDAGDIIVLRYRSGGWVFAFQRYSASSCFDTYSYYYTEIGLLEPEPAFMIEEDETKETNKDEVYTEKVLFEASDLNVLKSNWEFYKALTNTGEGIDICLYDKDNYTETVFLHDMPFEKVSGDFGGNKFKTIKLTSEKLCDNADDYLSFYPIS